VTRIGVDIDSTLHHYWDLFERIALDRFGVSLPYDEQRDWDIGLLEKQQLVECVRESHSDENVLAGVPYPDAVETVSAWKRAGHWIHVTSHRAAESRGATEEWLERIGLPYDDLHCSYDKVTRCLELEVDLLVDDSPVNIVRAREHGIAVATLIHPWNEHLVDEDGVVGARDWPALGRAVAPLLDARDSR
jgi:uncharacterized HAD superfamily protein